MNAAELILDFWFGPANADGSFSKEKQILWFSKNALFDQQVREKFLSLWEGALRGELDSLKESPRSRLALIILTDQMPRNMFRGEARAFRSDSMALELSKEGIQLGFDKELSSVERVFFYLPLEHSERLDDQRLCVQKFLELEQSTPIELRDFITEARDYAERHLAIIERFGRFPHRNRILSRESTKEELEFLKTPGSSF